MFQRLFEKFLFAFYVLILCVVLGVIGAYFTLSRDLPQLPAKLENINLSLPTEIYSSDGELMKILGERHPVPLNEISPYFLNAIIAVEDANFYRHSGLDHLALVRAMARNIKKGKVIQGGSTITQQLSKNLFFSFKRDWVRKVKELLVALQLEATFSKDRILEAYCNQIYFGNGAYGVEEASQVYFGKPARGLSLLQAAMLAGLPNSPNNANPFFSYERALRRAEFVLNRMVKVGFIRPPERDEALASTLDLVVPREESDPNLYFVDYVIDNLEKEYGREFVYFGGLKIFTTLDSRLQEFAQKAAETHLEVLDKRLKEGQGTGPLQVALASIENKTGAIRVMMGGRNHSLSQFNRAVSHNRLPGSSFKPFVYLTAMETLGYNPATVVRDEPVTIEIPGTQPWSPQNFEEAYAGEIILKKALMKSINIVSAKLVEQVTPERVIRTARKFGVVSPLGNHLSLALGTSGVSPLEMASAYSVIANLGVYNRPYFIQRIEDYSGNRLYEHFYHGDQRFTKKAIYPLLDMMQGVIDGGTGRVVRRMGFDHPAAGKTGTTNDFKDAWFDGFTRDYTTTVWVGYDHNEPMIDGSGRGLTGSGAAAPIWVYYMQKALEGKSKVKFTPPDGIKFAEVDPRTGYLVEDPAAPALRVALREEVELSPPPEPLPEEREVEEASSRSRSEPDHDLSNL